MAVVKDWIAEAAEAIAKDENCCFLEEGSASIQNVIEQHCPFRAGVAYMPVPRCDSCRWWSPGVAVRPSSGKVGMVGYGQCEQLGMSLARTCADFGCVEWETK